MPETAYCEADFLPSVVLAHAAAAPGSTAYAFVQATDMWREITYGDLVDGAWQVVHQLTAAACKRGDRVALMCGHGPDFIIGLLGTLLVGCAAVPVASPLTPVMRARARHILACADCSVVLTGDLPAEQEGVLRDTVLAGHRMLRVGDSVPRSTFPRVLTKPEDVAIVQFTSGSTSNPRGVVVTHAALRAQQHAIGLAVEPRADERVVTWLPPEHDMGLMGGLLFNLWRGQPTYVLSPAAFIRRPVRWLEAISRVGASISVAPNFAYDLCVRTVSPERAAGLDLSSWRVALNGAETVRPQTMERFARAFEKSGFDAYAFMPCYGLAEAVLLVAGASRGGGAVTGWFDAGALDRGVALPSDRGQGRWLASSGMVRTTGGVRIVNPESGEPCSPGQVGEIWIAGQSLGTGYFGSASDSERTFRARTADGMGPFLRSGDLGFLWGEQLYITGRIKDTILVHGKNLHAADLELALDAAHADVRPGRVAAHQGEDGSIALIVEIFPGRASADVKDLQQIAARLWTCLLGRTGVEAARVFLVRPGALLWTSSGKLQRGASFERVQSEPERTLIEWHPDGGVARRMKAIAVSRLTHALANEGNSASAYLRFFTQWIAAASGLEEDEVESDLSWSDQGLDSLMLTDLALDLELATGRQLPVERLFSLPSPLALATALESESSGP